MPPNEDDRLRGHAPDGVPRAGMAAAEAPSPIDLDRLEHAALELESIARALEAVRRRSQFRTVG